MKQRNFRKSNAGFTLVELIVVIAIMAILAGVGTVAYSGYIKTANKKADTVLVGNIMRAIETGTNSTMFVNDESMVIRNLTYPVGVITLSPTENATIITSSSKEKNVEGKCHFVTEEISYLEKTVKKKQCTNKDCDKSQKEEIFKLKKDTFTYCTTHSRTEPYKLAEAKAYNEDYRVNHRNKYSHTSIFQNSSVPQNTTFVDNIEQIYVLDNNNQCIYAANGGVISGVASTNDSSNPLVQSINAAFGENALNGELKLSYNQWLADEELNYATILSNSGNLISTIKLTADTLISLNKFPGINIITSDYLSENYSNADDMMQSLATYLHRKYPTKNSWIKTWNNAYSSDFDYTFGLSEAENYHNDYVYAATKAYNSCFASYLVANGIDPEVASIFENYSTTPNDGGDTFRKLSIALNSAGMSLDFIPRVVNNDSFTGKVSPNAPDATLEKIFLNKMKSLKGNSYNEVEATKLFSEIKALYDDYTDSSKGTSACEINGGTFYDMMQTVYDTSDIASSSGDYFKYYENYLNEMDVFYKAIENATKDGNIVIIVTVENGLVKCSVSPMAANPRND